MCIVSRGRKRWTGSLGGAGERRAEEDKGKVPEAAVKVLDQKTLSQNNKMSKADLGKPGHGTQGNRPPGGLIFIFSFIFRELIQKVLSGKHSSKSTS